MLDSEQRHENLGHVADAARAAIAQEFAITERLENKARAQVTMAGAWFAVAQAVSGVALGVSGLARAWVVILGSLALSGAAVLIGLALASRGVWKLYEEKEIGKKALEELLEMADDPNPKTEMLGVLVRQSAWTLDHRRTNNAKRAAAFLRTEIWWFLALTLALSQVLVAFLARAIG